MKLRSSDGHEFDAYEVGPESGSGLVVVQEIFGLNQHIRSVSDRYAAEGYRVISPALFDRVEREVELGYSPQELKRGRRLAAQVGYLDHPLLELSACLEWLGPGRTTAVVGFCWGGTLAWAAATRLAPHYPQLKACVGYYGGMIGKLLDRPPQVPTLLHYGRHDPYISQEEVETVRRTYPQVEIHVYEAGHGFNCEQRTDYDPMAAQLAWQRTTAFLER